MLLAKTHTLKNEYTDTEHTKRGGRNGKEIKNRKNNLLKKTALPNATKTPLNPSFHGSLIYIT